MKKIIVFITVFLLVGGCSMVFTTPKSDVQVDLTQLSSTMVYSEVSQMLMQPEDYIGKSVRIKGMIVHFKDEKTQKTYVSCLIMDALKCCQQGIEFELKENTKLPRDGTEITLKGIYDFQPDDVGHAGKLKNAVLEKIEEPK
ncbi:MULTISPECIES: hypothetical protein [Terrabacteria group]|uniref:hypothetical protein n=1 Tax=Bacillati TaxID=1783272 RepID=UPI00193A07FB|nr:MULTISPECIES: hypothetical protein [Terrabacteria group]MBW9212997.1 hypothetical protein [Trueperella sp. zg.1013]QRG87039.1 hypothetical protein JOS54_01660 [Bulleidia sp. zg-1006]